MVGRRIELARLCNAVDEVRNSGSGRLLMIAGEAGIGKSRLASGLLDEARDRGGVIAWGSCRETDGAPPYWPWTQVLRALVGSDDSDEVLTPLLQPGESSRQPDRFLLFDAVGRALAVPARTGCLVVILDDVHRADDASLAPLRFLTSSLHGMPLLMVGTYRDTDLATDDPLARLIGDLAGSDVFELIEL